MATLVIQARMSSHRLRGKVLMPIGGIPVVVLAVRRASNLGAKIRIATSTDKDDDLLADLAERNGIPLFRGPLQDVLHRFVLATADLPENETIVRLTADNVFPDGAFIRDFLAAYEKKGDRFLNSDAVFEGMPHGLVAEAFALGALREADKKAESAYDREHVTPWIIRHYASPRAGNSQRPLGATIDSMDDYQRIAQVFTGIRDPVGVSHRELCARLAAAAGIQVPSRFVAGAWMSELTLSAGCPDPCPSIEIMRHAIAHGVDGFDTARDDDSGEQLVGKALKPYGGRIRAMTKLAAMDDLDINASPAEVCRAVDASIFRSCRELGVTSLPCLLLHRWAQRNSHQGAVWNRLLELRAEGIIGHLGVSVTSPFEAQEALQDPEIRAIQMPFNLLDHRWHTPGINQLALQRSDVLVYARIILQGPDTLLSRLDEIVRQLGRRDRIDLCLAFVRSQPWIHSLVMGVESFVQLEDLFFRFTQPALSVEEVELLRKLIRPISETLLNRPLAS